LVGGRGAAEVGSLRVWRTVIWRGDLDFGGRAGGEEDT
jgi:hypothetical protein